MADEFQLQAEFCGGTAWWMNPPMRSSMMFGSSPCSSAGMINLDLGSFGWPSDFQDMKTTTTTTIRSSLPDDDHHHHSQNSPNSDGSSSIVIQDHLQKPNSTQQQDSATSNTIDSTLPIDWDPSLMNGSDQQSNNYNQNSGMNFRQEMSEVDRNCTSDPSGFPMNNLVSYGYPSSLLQTLFDNSEPQQIQEPLFTNRAMNYHQTSLMNELPPSLPKFSATAPSQKLQLPNSLPFSASVGGQSFCNGSSAAALNDLRAGFFPSTPSQFLPSTFNDKPNLPSLSAAKANSDEVQGSGTATKKSGSGEPAFKRPRIETPTPLPTFKVRKEKLGDRITALQQLVSPFGKTDTASVLHEAIEYIKFLHDQVNVLSTPYMKNGSPINHRQQMTDKSRNQEEKKEGLKSRGLCLVPISSTFPVAAETTTDFWTPTFGGTFR